MNVENLDITLGAKYELCDKNNNHFLVIITEEQDICSDDEYYTGVDTGEEYECYTLKPDTMEEDERAVLYIDRYYNCVFMIISLFEPYGYVIDKTQETIDIKNMVKINDAENALLKMKNAAAAAEED
jgi:hypothetical protein